MWVVFTLHLCATCAMAGVIWIVQLVHYPAFLFVAKERFAEFERFHCARISFVVMPLMFLELGTAAILLLQSGLGANPVFGISLGILFLLWVSTFALHAPLHRALTQGWNAELIERLIRRNWLRTIGWTSRGVLLGVLCGNSY
jgi:hypothetical protein